MRAVAIPALSFAKNTDGSYNFNSFGLVRLGWTGKREDFYSFPIAFIYASDAGDDGEHVAHVVLRHASGKPIARQISRDDERTSEDPVPIEFEVPPKPFSYTYVLPFFAHLSPGSYLIVLTMDGREVFTWPLEVIDVNKRQP